MKKKILEILNARGGYVSGQELCELLGVSRTAIWKNIKQLKEAGYEIEAVQNKGYHIVSAPDVLNQEVIESALGSLPYKVCYKSTVDSTNTVAKQLGENQSPSKTLVAAEEQTMGKGRRGRIWSSPYGKDIYMTLMLRADIMPENASMLTLVMGLSVAQAIQKTTGLDTAIKWPNDVVVNGKKVCGILTEMSAQMDYINYLVIGVGINVNGESFPEELRDKATSLFIETKKEWKRAELIAECMRRFEENYNQFLETQDLSLLQEAYGKYLVNKDRPVRVLEPRNEYNGIARGINTQGELLVEREDGSVQQVYAGEVSVRGVYGYV
ncbi:MAG: biotin--[acetyl-CoA-carboxylase] ligase [Lachnospiraceae bacterium]|nr:biotin--[acetyl-CoA-carboxylase] ligase [Lachnospiraceae bacterium]